MAEAMLRRVARARIFGKSLLGAWLRLNQWVWNRLPRSMRSLRPVRSYGHWMHALVHLQADRRMYLGTFFLRNRPELELIRRLAKVEGERNPVKVAVLGCSNGAEVYSIAWAVRSARRDLKLVAQAVDISADAVELARKGVYSLGISQLVNEPALERMTSRELEEMFDREGSGFRIKQWIREGIAWHVGDAGDPGLLDTFGPQHIVVANRFLCHMQPLDAEKCLRSIGRLVVPGGYLFVSGVDLDVRTKVASDLGWKPFQDLMEDIHDGDPSLRIDWPCHYWGLEPMDKTRRDWKIRYASVFQIPA